MKSPTVADLKAGKASGGIFLVQTKDVREGKTGRKYMSLTLMDRTGEIGARMWDNVEAAAITFDRDDFVRADGEMQEYQGKQQLIVHRIRKADNGEADLQDFLPASQRATAEMFAELQTVIAGLRDPHLKALLDALFADDSIRERFCLAPAAKSIHHAWLGGLLEHVLSMCRLARVTGEHYVALGYPVDVDLLLAGAILHDLGKIEELNYERSFGYSAPGQLLGHIFLGVQMIGEKLRTLPDFPPKLRMLLEHMILSHHGQLEFGSPKLPVFLEAMLLHQLDNLDSKMAAIVASTQKDRDAGSDWTAYNPALERQLLDKEAFLREKPETPSSSLDSAPRAISANSAKTGQARKSTAIGSALFAALDSPTGGR